MDNCIHCFIQIDEGKWCSMECKRKFLVANYDPMATIRTMSEEHEKHMIAQKKTLEEMKKSKLTASEYIMGTKDNPLTEKVDVEFVPQEKAE